MWGAVGLLEFDDYRRRVGALPTREARERREAVDRVLSAEELLLVDRIIGGGQSAKEHEELRARLGPRPDDEDLIAMWGQILGRPPHLGG